MQAIGVQSVPVPVAFPPLVQLLVPLSQPDLQERCVSSLFINADNQVAIAAAGAFPQLVRLLGAGSPAPVQHYVAAVLVNLAHNADNAVSIVSAGAMAPSLHWCCSCVLTLTTPRNGLHLQF
jgi:hypothetical protein